MERPGSRSRLRNKPPELVCGAIKEYGVLEIQISPIMAGGTDFVLKLQYSQMEKI